MTVEKEKNRYNVRPARDFNSAFELRQKRKEEARIEEQERKEREEEAARIAVSNYCPTIN